MLYALKRLLQVPPMLLGMSVVAFALLYVTPGDPVQLLLGENYDPRIADQLRARYGFDQPLPVQYVRWLGRALQGDLGTSVFTGRPVTAALVSRGILTLQLSVLTLAISLLIALPLGVVSAVRKDSWVDLLSRVLTMIGISMPSFWLGLLLMLLFSLSLGLLPPGGSPREYGFKAFIMPALSLGLTNAALIARITRSAMVEVLGQDYVRTAIAKGVWPRRINYKHALRNAMLPIVTVVGLQFGFLLSGAVLTEYIFSFPGIGTLLVNSVYQRDFAVIQGGLLLTGTVFVLVNLLVDLLYGALDPRIQYS